MQLDLLRLVILLRSQMEAFERVKADGSRPNREEWLRDVFSGQISFVHRGIGFHYVPADTPDPRFIVGRIGRQLSVKENEPPESGLQETRRSAWKAVNVLIDPRAHEDGQKVAVEFDSRVGKPLALFQSLAAHLNGRDNPEPYIMEVNSIVDPETFWKFVHDNEGKVISVTFELVVPNMFGQRDDLDKEMRELRDHEKARRAILSLQNEDGLNLETERIRRTASYADEGGGEIKATAKGHKYFSSTNRAKRINLKSDPDEPIDAPSLLQKALAWAFGE